MWRSHWPVSMPRRGEENSRPWLHYSAFFVQVADCVVPPIMNPVIHPAEVLDEIRVSRCMALTVPSPNSAAGQDR